MYYAKRRSRVRCSLAGLASGGGLLGSWLAGSWLGGLLGWLASGLSGWLACGLSGWLAGGLSGWLAGGFSWSGSLCYRTEKESVSHCSLRVKRGQVHVNNFKCCGPGKHPATKS